MNSLSAGDAERLERKASMAIELSWKKRAEHNLSDLVLSFMKAGLMHLRYTDVQNCIVPG